MDVKNSSVNVTMDLRAEDVKQVVDSISEIMFSCSQFLDVKSCVIYENRSFLVYYVKVTVFTIRLKSGAAAAITDYPNNQLV